ncbi:MAG TPA: pilus assembly protein PilP [Thermoanaerobaculia bacterium]|nr:pilus assembly protein PilP [Thermoanaerobaculia bacterium]
MKRSNFFYSLLIVIAAVATVVAQTPAPTTTAAGDTTTSGTSSEVQKTLEDILEEPTTTDTYRYDPQGRRDPFRSLIGPAPRLATGQRPEGVPGFMIDEMRLQGIFTTRQGLTAMVNGPDNKGYTIRAGDKVFDGEVIRITKTSVVFRQEVNDPTRIERYREVVKDLSPSGKRP